MRIARRLTNPCVHLDCRRRNREIRPRFLPLMEPQVRSLEEIVSMCRKLAEEGWDEHMIAILHQAADRYARQADHAGERNTDGAKQSLS